MVSMSLVRCTNIAAGMLHEKQVIDERVKLNFIWGKTKQAQKQCSILFI